MKKIMLLVLFCGSFAFPQSLQSVYNFPYYNPYNYFWGVCSVGSDLWIATDYDNSQTYPFAKMYRVTKNGVILDSVDTPFKFNHGLAYDGANFWVAEDYRTAGARVFKISPAGIKLDSIALPSLIGGATGGIGDIEISGGFLWFSVYYPDFTSYPNAYAYKMDLTSRAVVDTIPLRGRQVQGITVKGDTVFYVSDNFQGDIERVYAYRKATGDTLFSFPLADPDGDSNPKGLHWDGSNLWLIADRSGGAALAYRSLYKYILGGSGTPLLTTQNSLAFGDVTIGLPQQLSLTVNSVGTGDLRIDSLRLDNTFFSISPVNTPHILPPQQSKTYTITFAPQNPEAQTCSLKIYSTDAVNPVKIVTLTGRGVYGLPYISLSHDSMLIIPKRVNSTSSRELKITNMGGGKLRIDSIKAGTTAYYLFNQTFPQFVDSTKNTTFNIWFKPTALTQFNDTIRVYSNASNGNEKKMAISGSGIPVDTALGSIIWQGWIPPNPMTSSNDLSAKNIKDCPDINGDGVKDLIVTTDNYYTIAYNGNSSGNADILWKFSTYPSNVNAGSVERMQCVQIASDLDGDNFADVVIGTAGGNESVIAISGKTGKMIWEYGDSVNYNNGDIMGIDVKRDFNSDGIPDVIATASGNETSLVGRFATYCLNGATGAILWEINEASEVRLKYGAVSTDEGGAFGSRVAGATAGRVTGFNKSGTVLWHFPTPRAPWAVAEIQDIGGQPGSDVLIGDTGGGIFAVDGKTGIQIWTRSIGSAFVEDIFVVDDVNGNGTKDVLISALVSPVYLLEGRTGEIIWSANTGGTVLGAGQIGDLTGDGIPEMGAVNLSTYLRVYNGVNGQEIYNWQNTVGTGDKAIESVWGIGNADGYGSVDFAAGTRPGIIMAFAGGPGTSGQPSITVNSPNGGENLAAGTTHQITWTSIGVTNVKIEYSYDNGTSWNVISAAMPAGQGSYGWQVPPTPTTQALVRVSDASNTLIFDVSNAVFTITSSGSQAVIPLQTGWNIVSVPLAAANMTTAALFPLATSNAFWFNNGYVPYDTLQMNRGFWVRYPQAANITVTGTSLSATAVPVSAGWNLIGIHHYNVAVAAITSNPPGILNSLFFGYANGYTQPATLEVGKGYWVRSSQNGLINIPLPMEAKIRAANSLQFPKELKTLTVSDADGKTFSLYFTAEQGDFNFAALPPVPPQPVFDVRFSDNTFVADANTRVKIVQIQGAIYPLSVRITGMNARITDAATSGTVFNASLSNGEAATIGNPNVTVLAIETDALPTEYTLSQNYPNPFNPATSIQYSLPEKSRVSLKIYNHLGEVVAVLADEEKDAGYYTAKWNAASAVSGVYYYQLNAGNFSSVRKMLLVK